MAIAIYNPTTNKVFSFVKSAKGALPDGYEFLDEADLPAGWTREAPPPREHYEIDLLEFWQRWTRAERVALHDRARANSNMAERLMMLNAREKVRTDSQPMSDFLDAAIAAGIIDAARKSAILEL
jgi:hypothetical protein